MKQRKTSKAIDFIEYISKPMERDEMYKLYKINNIKVDKIELFYDFIYGLFDLIVTTHMGDDFMTEEDDVKHFKWCWDKTVTNFKKEKIFFNNNKELYTYFSVLIYESYYCDDKSEENNKKLLGFWETCFTYRGIKTMSEFEALVDIYKLFNKSLHTI